MSDLREKHPFNRPPLKRGKDANKFDYLLHAVGMTALAPMKKGVGINHLGLFEIGASTGLMLAASWLGNTSWLPLGLGHDGPPDYSLLCYAFAYPAIALYQRQRRQKEIANGALPEDFHPDSIGRGRFGFLPLQERFNAFACPFAVLLGSLLLVFRLHVAGLLGLWGIVAGLAFLALQAQAYNHGEMEFRGSLGSIASANARGEVLSRIEKAPSETQQRQEANKGTIATGMDDLLQAEIERRGKNKINGNTGGLWPS